MKKFIAHVEERYTWKCPYCGEYCDSECDDPEDMGTIECEHCGKVAKCELTER